VFSHAVRTRKNKLAPLLPVSNKGASDQYSRCFATDALLTARYHSAEQRHYSTVNLENKTVYSEESLLW